MTGNDLRRGRNRIPCAVVGPVQRGAPVIGPPAQTETGGTGDERATTARADAGDDLVVAALQRARAAPRRRARPGLPRRHPRPAGGDGRRPHARAGAASPACSGCLAARADDAAAPAWRTRLTAGLAGAALTVTAAASLVALAARRRPGRRALRPQARHRADPARPGRRLPRADPARLRQHPARRAARTSSTAADARCRPPAARRRRAARCSPPGADPELVIATLETMDDQTTEGTAWLTDRAVTTVGRRAAGRPVRWAADADRRARRAAPRSCPTRPAPRSAHSLTCSPTSPRAPTACRRR